MGDLTTTLDLDADVNVGETLLAQKQDWLLDLGAESVWLDELEWRSVDLEETVAFLGVGKGDGGLLATEHLDSLGWGSLL